MEKELYESLKTLLVCVTPSIDNWEAITTAKKLITEYEATAKAKGE